ncbi:sugar transferase [Nocardioides dongxiaopingii]|uniref:sugar transferase n=1 Tax=Nocardioides sp. S-1144 TaxID=2582905 RepID=UPI0021CB6F83|nr:sugar transferase [Nocardioides sp. S-1144]
MAQMFDVSEIRTHFAIERDRTAHEAAAPLELGPAPRLGARVTHSLRRLPWVTLLVGSLAVVLTAVALTADVRAALGVLLLLWVQVPAAQHRSGPAPAAVSAATARHLALGAAVLVVALHLLAGGPAVLDDALALGAVGLVVATGGAALGARRAHPPRVLLVGDLPQVRGMVARWIDDGSVRVVGGLALGATPERAATGLGDLGIAAIATLDDVVEHVRRHATDLVVVAPGLDVTPADLRRLSWNLQSTETRLAVVSATDDVAPHRIVVAAVGGSTVELVAAPGGGTTYALAKTVADRVLAAALVVVASPVLLVAALAIRLDSAGPALFRQVRVGRDGVPFTMYKMRTMTTEAEHLRAELEGNDDGNGVLFKMHRDPRVTRVGRLLRSSSLDELPQLLNVVLGQMSLVGPRPALPKEVACFTDGERRRLAVKPGITGPWQVSGRSLLSRERSMQLDTGYVDNGRGVADISILLRTVSAVLSRRGAF